MSRTYRNCNIYLKHVFSSDKPYFSSMDKKADWWNQYDKKCRNKEIRRSGKKMINEYFSDTYSDVTYDETDFYETLCMEYGIHKN